jgi:Ca-activated chloride channel family protein
LIELAAPLALLALPAPLLAMRLLPPRSEPGQTLLLPERIGQALIEAQKGPAGQAMEHIRARFGRGLLWATWLFLLLALAGPRSVAPVPALKVSGRDLAVVLDLSGSMVRDDFELDGRAVTRQEAVTRVGADFVRRRGGDRVALVVFGSEAYYAAPFSFDVDAVARQIETAEIGISGRATNISDGLGLALRRMRDSDAASRVIILLSDGVNNAGAARPRGVAEMAAAMGVRIHTIALGPRSLSEADPGENGVVDAETLRALARLSGGESFRVRTTDDLVAVAAALDRLEATDSDGLAAEVYRALWPWPAGAALVCLGLFAWREQA